jgi:hypothetical protein
MSEGAAHIVDSMTDLQLTENGLYLLLHGNQATTALHRSVLDQLVVALPNAIEHSDRLINNNEQRRRAPQRAAVADMVDEFEKRCGHHRAVLLQHRAEL